MIRSFLVAGAIATVLMAGVGVNKSQAQQSRTTGSTGLGSTGLGGSTLGGSSMGTGFGTTSASGFGASSLGSSSLGASSFGQSSLGSSGFGAGQQSAFGGQSGLGQTGLGSATNGYGAFSQQSGYAGFGQTTGVTGQTGRGTTGLNGATGRTGQTRTGQNQGNRLGTGNTGAQQNVQPQVPVRLQLAYEPPRPSVAAVAANVQSNLQEIAAAKRLGRVQVIMDGGVTVLTGSAPSVGERTVIEKIASMQPGVTTIRNEIVIAPDEDSNGTSATSGN